MLTVWTDVSSLWIVIIFLINNYSDKSKGQLISKCLFGIFNSPQKWTKKFNFTYYYGTSSRIVFVSFLGELKTPKRNFEINWPLVCVSKRSYTYCVKSMNVWMIDVTDKFRYNLSLSNWGKSVRFCLKNLEKFLSRKLPNKCVHSFEW